MKTRKEKHFKLFITKYTQMNIMYKLIFFINYLNVKKKVCDYI